MNRRRIIAALGAAAAWPLGVCAQQTTLPVVGFMHPGSPEGQANLVSAFRKGLSETGYIEGRNVAIDYRWGNNDNERLPELAADLVRRRVAVIATPGASATALAAKALTTTIPIVFSVGGDPVQFGLVPNFNRPGGNITGINSMNLEVTPKRIGLMHELLPTGARFALLINPNSTNAGSTVEHARAAAADQLRFGAHSISSLVWVRTNNTSTAAKPTR